MKLEITQNPRFTIGLPIIKTEFVEKTIESILNQSYEDFELVIVNNAKSLEKKREIEGIVKKYTEAKIRYIKNDIQLPMIKNWNKVLSLARGKFFVLCCDDDTYENNFLLEINSLINKYPHVNLFKTRIKLIDENDNTIAIGEINREHESLYDFLWHRVVKSRMHYLSEFVCKTEELKKIGGFVDFYAGWGSDTFTWFLMSEREGICSSNKLLSNHRLATLNASVVSNVEKRFEAIDIYKEKFEIFLNGFNPIEYDNKLILEDVLKNLIHFYQRKYNVLYKTKAVNSGFITFLKFLLTEKKRYPVNFKNIISLLYSNIFS